MNIVHQIPIQHHDCSYTKTLLLGQFWYQPKTHPFLSFLLSSFLLYQLQQWKRQKGKLNIKLLFSPNIIALVVLGSGYFKLTAAAKHTHKS